MSVPDGFETRRVLVFLAVAFGVAWAVGAYIHVTGGLAGSPTLVSGVPVSRATILLATGYMWAPALANLLTRRRPVRGGTTCDSAHTSVPGGPTGSPRGCYRRR